MPTPKKSTTKSAPAKAQSEGYKMGLEIAALIKTGALDEAMVELSEAFADRFARHNDEKNKIKKSTAKSTTEEKVVPQPTRKAASVTPEVGKTYTIDEKLKVHGGKKGKFLRYLKGDKTKAVLDIGGEKPIAVPTAALRRAATPAARKSAPAKKTAAPAKKAPAKRTAAKK